MARVLIIARIKRGGIFKLIINFLTFEFSLKFNYFNLIILKFFINIYANDIFLFKFFDII